MTNPALVLVVIDVIVPAITRDYVNMDGDYVSEAPEFFPGPYLSSSILFAPGTMLVTYACYVDGPNFDPAAVYYGDLATLPRLCSRACTTPRRRCRSPTRRCRAARRT